VVFLGKPPRQESFAHISVNVTLVLQAAVKGGLIKRLVKELLRAYTRSHLYGISYGNAPCILSSFHPHVDRTVAMSISNSPYGPITSSGTVTSYLPLTTAWSAPAQCSSLFLDTGGNLSQRPGIPKWCSRSSSMHATTGISMVVPEPEHRLADSDAAWRI